MDGQTWETALPQDVVGKSWPLWLGNVGWEAQGMEPGGLLTMLEPRSTDETQGTSTDPRIHSLHSHSRPLEPLPSPSHREGQEGVGLRTERVIPRDCYLQRPRLGGCLSHGVGPEEVSFPVP